MDYTQIQFEGTTESQNEILVALLDNIGFEGFEENIGILKACIPTGQFDEAMFNSVIDINRFKYSKSIINKENWNAKWEAEFQPISIYYPNSTKPFVYLKAGFHEANNEFEYNIEITPKMSFGTGHHATTYLMVEQMSGINFEGKTTIDFGTGTGVLAILAEKLGSKHILAIDCDDWSIENTMENIEKNQCKAIETLQAYTIPTGNKADIILANINLNIISDNIVQIKNACLPHTKILFSGIMQHDKDNIISVLQNNGIEVNQVYKKDNWLAIMASY